MKKFITFGLIATAAVYYACVPLVVAQAGGSPATSTTAPVETVTSNVLSVLSMRVTAYASVPDETDSTPFITADGSHVFNGEVASNLLPFGTRIEIPALFGDEIFTVHDRMSQRIKNTIDIWMPSVKQALFFGAQHANILVLGPATSTTAISTTSTQVAFN